MDRRRYLAYLAAIALFAIALLLPSGECACLAQALPPGVPTKSAEKEPESKTAAAEERAEPPATQRQRWTKEFADFAVVAVPRIAVIVVLLCVALYAVRMFGRRLIMLWSSTARRTAEEGRYRAETLVSVFENTATTAI